MSARIIQFRPRGAASSPREVSPSKPAPPVVTSKRRWIDGELNCVTLIGTRESFISWGVAAEAEFPEGRKKKKYNGPGRPDIRQAFTTFGLYEATWHLPRAGKDDRQAVIELLEDIASYSSSTAREAERRLSELWSLRLSLFVHQCSDESNAQLHAFDIVMNQLKGIVEAALMRQQRQAASN